MQVFYLISFSGVFVLLTCLKCMMNTYIVVQGEGSVKPMARLCVVDKRWGHNVKESGEEMT